MYLGVKSDDLAREAVAEALKLKYFLILVSLIVPTPAFLGQQNSPSNLCAVSLLDWSNIAVGNDPEPSRMRQHRINKEHDR